MSERSKKSIQISLSVLLLAAFLLMCASWYGWAMVEYRSAFSSLFAALFIANLAANYVLQKEFRAVYRTYAAWAVAISIPLIGLAFLRDYWINGWFQLTLFPAVFGPVMVATLLGYVLAAYFAFRSKRQAG